MKKLTTLLSVVFVLFNCITAFSQVAKTPLLEEFTSSTCGPCAGNNPTLDAMLNSNTGNFVCIKYQMNWPGAGDPYYNSDGGTRKTSYGVTGIPDLYVNGSVISPQPMSYLSSHLTADQNLTTSLVIDAHFTLIDSVITVFGNLLPQSDITGNIRRHVAVVERHTYNNASSNGETEFSYVEQKMLPNGAGVYTTGLNTGASIPFSQTFDLSNLNDIENYSNLMFAVWVQNSTTKEIYQATWATFPTGIQETINTASGVVKFFPNPASTQTTVDYQLQDNASVSLKIINTVGQVVSEKNIGNKGFGLHQEIINTNLFASGIYFVELQIGNNSYRQPLMVQ